MKATYQVKFVSTPESDDALGNDLYQLEQDVRLALWEAGDQSAQPSVEGERNTTQSSWLLLVPTSVALEQVDTIVEAALKKVRMMLAGS